MNSKYIELIEEYNNVCDNFINGLSIEQIISSLSMLPDDYIATAYRAILECEVFNIIAKTGHGVSTYNYSKKHHKIKELNALCKSHNINYGYNIVDNCNKPHVIYYDLPGCEQISFHTFFSEDELNEIPVYNKEWDQQVNSSLGKIQKAISNEYENKLAELYDEYKEYVNENNKKALVYNTPEYISDHLKEMVEDINNPKNLHHYIAVIFTPNGHFYFNGTPEKRFDVLAGPDGKFITQYKKSLFKTYKSPIKYDAVKNLSYIKYACDDTYVNQHHIEKEAVKANRIQKELEKRDKELNDKIENESLIKEINSSDNVKKNISWLIPLLRDDTYRRRYLEIVYDDNGFFINKKKKNNVNRRFNVVFDVDNKPKNYSKNKILIYGDDYKLVSSFRLVNVDKALVNMTDEEVNIVLKTLV